MRAWRNLPKFAAVATVAGGIAFTGASAAVADGDPAREKVASRQSSAGTAAALPPDCTSGGMVDKKVEGSPVGIYGGAHIRCGRIPNAVNTVSAEVTLTRDGLAVAYDKGVCDLPPNGGGCYAGTPIVANPAGVQNWCAKARTVTTWATWSRTYCNSY